MNSIIDSSIAIIYFFIAIIYVFVIIFLPIILIKNFLLAKKTTRAIKTYAKKFLNKILSLLLIEKITSTKSNVYIKDDLVGRITIEYSRLFKSYRVNKQTEKELHCKIQNMFSNYIKVFTPDEHFVFVEKRGWRYSADIELFCNNNDKELLHARLIRNKLIY